MLSTFGAELESSGWYNERWLDDTLNQIVRSFDRACDRWRGLYLAAHAQRNAANRVIVDASATREAKDRAKRLRQEAESQLDLLMRTENVFQADFYSYRYFASE